MPTSAATRTDLEARARAAIRRITDGHGCMRVPVLVVLGIAAVLALGAWKKQAACDWTKEHAPQRADEVCR